MGNISPQQKNTAFTLEHNLHFDRVINELHGRKVTGEMLNSLRKDLKDRGIYELSSFWNHLLEMKIQTPALNLSEITAGSAPIFSFLPEPEPYLQLIGVYPETSEKDVLRALKSIRSRFPKAEKTQAVGEKVYDIVFSLLKKGKTVGEIMNDENFKKYIITRNNLQAIVDTMRIGL